MDCYDLYLPIGSACCPAHHLNVNDLRHAAYPLDWQMEYSLDTVIHLFRTNFVDFFVDIEEDSVDWDREYRRIRDVRNNIVSIHHFPRSMEIKKTQIEFLNRMNKRYQNLNKKLMESNKVVLICNRADTIETLQMFLKDFSSIYPHLEIKLINIRNNVDMEANAYDKKEHIVGDSLTIEEYIFNDTINSLTREGADWRGNVGMWMKVLESYADTHYFESMKKIKEISNGVVIYGAGKRCLDLLCKFNRYNVQIDGIAVTNPTGSPKCINQYKVDIIERYSRENIIIISLADMEEAERVKSVLKEKRYRNIYFVNNNLKIEKYF